MSDKICSIIIGGEESIFDNIDKSEYIIACDKGYYYSLKNSIKVNLFIGDKDSYSGKIDDNVKVLNLPKEKDDTDTLYAIRHALNLGFNEINLYCALGGRIDHMIGNIQSSSYAVKNGAKVNIIDKKCIMHFLSNDSIILKKRTNVVASLLSISDNLLNVSIKNAKYNLDNVTLNNTFPIGISNEFKDDDIIISVGDGIALVVETIL